MNINYLRGFFLDNLSLKLVSLFIGFSLWFFISSEQSVQKIIEVPVEIINKPASLEIANDYTKSVLLQIQTPQLDKSNLSKTLAAVIDLSNAHTGENVILLTPMNFRTAESIKIISIRPPTITLILEPKLKNVVPVKIPIIGKPAKHYKVININYMPKMVTISGPASHVRKINEISTQSIKISGLRKSLTTAVNLMANNPFISLGFNSKIQVTINIEEEKIRLVFRNLRIKVKNVNSKFRLYPKVVTVWIRVPYSLRKDVNRDSFEIYVDGKDYKTPGKYEKLQLHFNITQPRFQGLLETEKLFPDTIKLKISPTRKKNSNKNNK